jgi:hypothetical protein
MYLHLHVLQEMKKYLMKALCRLDTESTLIPLGYVIVICLSSMQSFMLFACWQGRQAAIAPKQTSSINFGEEKPSYQSIAQEAMAYKGTFILYIYILNCMHKCICEWDRCLSLSQFNNHICITHMTYMTD